MVKTTKELALIGNSKVILVEYTLTDNSTVHAITISAEPYVLEISCASEKAAYVLYNGFVNGDYSMSDVHTRTYGETKHVR